MLSMVSRMNINALIGCWSVVLASLVIAFGNIVARSPAFALAFVSDIGKYSLYKFIFFSIALWAVGCILLILIHWLFDRFSR